MTCTFKATIQGSIYTLCFLSLFSLLLYSCYFTPNVGPSDLSNYSKNHTNTIHSITIDDSEEYTTTVLQLTDLHLSTFNSHERIDALSSFLKLFSDLARNSTENPLRPLDLLLITGDLTDGRGRNYVQGKQNEQEWKYYREAVLKSNITDSGIPVVDILGNHDVYGALDSHFYKKYSFSGENGTKITHKIQDTLKPNTCYDFVPVDAAPLPGVGRPLNFVGYVRNTNLINQYQNKACNISVFYSHYPLSSIFGFRTKKVISQKASVYLSGHLHEGAGGIPGDKMYAMHRFEQPLAEFELGDWRDHRRARLITFDHGLFNFEDFDYEDSEKGKLVVSVTNPKPKAQYLSGKEPLERIEKSTHIRVVVYLLNATDYCQDTIKIQYHDSQTAKKLYDLTNFKLTSNVTNQNNTFTRLLFTTSWKPQPLNFTITASCNFSKTEILRETKNITFDTNLLSTLNQETSFSSKLTLLTNIPAVAVGLFYAGFLFCYLYLVKIHQWFWTNRHSVVKKLWRLLIIFGFWLVLGPWYIGNLIDKNCVLKNEDNDVDLIEPDDNTIYDIECSGGSLQTGAGTFGVVFSYGILLFKGGKLVFIQDHTTYIMGVVIIWTFYFPCILLTHLYSAHITFSKKLLNKSEGEQRGSSELTSQQSSSSPRTQATEPISSPKQPSSAYNARYFFYFLTPFACFVWFQISHFYQLVLAYGGSYMFFTSPIAIFTVVLPLSMLLHGTHTYFKNKYYYELVPIGHAQMVASVNYSTATTLPENRVLPELSDDEEVLDEAVEPVIMDSPHMPVIMDSPHMPARLQDDDETPLLD